MVYLNVNQKPTENKSLEDDPWSPEIISKCNEAQASGIVMNKATGKKMTVKELDVYLEKYQKVKNTMPVDEFMEDKINIKLPNV